MTSWKRIMVSIPAPLLKEFDSLVAGEDGNRSEFVRQAMRLFIAERKRREIRERLIQGYQEMAQLNLHLAEESLLMENGGTWPAGTAVEGG